MILKQLRRYYFSKFSIVIGILLSVITVIGYYFVHLSNEWLFALVNANASNLNVHRLTDLVDSFANGIFYFENLVHFSNHEFAFLFWNVAMICFGVFLGAQTFTDVQSNYGALIMSRMSYRKYFFNTLIAQTWYMVSYIIGFFLIVLLLSITIIGGGFIVPAGSMMADHSLILYLIKLFSPIFLGLSYLIPTVLIASVGGVFIKNKYILQLIPFLYIIGAPIIYVIFHELNLFYMGFIMVEHSMYELSQWLITERSFWDFTWTILIYPTFALSVFKGFCFVNIQKFSKEYLA